MLVQSWYGPAEVLGVVVLAGVQADVGTEEAIMSGRWVSWLVVLAAAGSAGCAGRARVELAAADALDALAVELGTALAEYQADLERADGRREGDLVAAFVARVQRDHADEAALAEHERAFVDALGRVRADRRVAWERYGAAQDNVAVAREVAGDLRGVALEGFALEEAARDYLNRLLEAQAAGTKVKDSGATAEAMAAGQE